MNKRLLISESAFFLPNLKNTCKCSLWDESCLGCYIQTVTKTQQCIYMDKWVPVSFLKHHRHPGFIRRAKITAVQLAFAQCSCAASSIGRAGFWTLLILTWLGTKSIFSLVRTQWSFLAPPDTGQELLKGKLYSDYLAVNWGCKIICKSSNIYCLYKIVLLTHIFTLI